MATLLDRYLKSDIPQRIIMVLDNDSLIPLALKDDSLAYISVILQDNKHRNWNSGYVLDSALDYKATFKWYYSIGMSKNEEFDSEPFSFHEFLKAIQKDEIFIEDIKSKYLE